MTTWSLPAEIFGARNALSRLLVSPQEASGSSRAIQGSEAGN